MRSVQFLLGRKVRAAWRSRHDASGSTVDAHRVTEQLTPACSDDQERSGDCKQYADDDHPPPAVECLGKHEPDPGDHDQEERDLGQKDARPTRKLHAGMFLSCGHSVLLRGGDADRRQVARL